MEKSVTDTSSTKPLLNQTTEEIVQQSSTNPFLRSKLKILLNSQHKESGQSAHHKTPEIEEEISTFKKESKSNFLARVSKLKEI